MRFYKLGETSFGADEFLDINSSYAYHKTGVWQNWDFNFGRVNTENVFQARDERAWIYKWQVAEILKHFPPTESNVRAISALWGIITIILMYLAGAYFSRRKEIGLLSAFLFAISISGIIFDRRLRMYSMFFAVFLAFAWFTYRFLEEEYKGKNKFIKNIQNKTGFNLIYLVPAAAMGIASYLAHQLTVNIIFIIAVYSIIQLIISARKNSNWFNKYSIIIIFMFLGSISASIFMPKTFQVNLAGLQFFNNHYGYILKAFSDYSHLLIAMIITAFGICYLYRQEKLEKEALWLSASFLGTLIFAIFIWSRNIGDQYIFFIKSFGIILIACGIYGLAIFFSENLSKYKKYSFLASVILLLMIVPDYAYFFQTDNVYKQTSESENPNFRRVFAFFKKSKTDSDVLISRKFRNYYWSGAEVKVFDFGGEVNKNTKKLTLPDLQQIVQENLSGWFIISTNDEVYISNDALDWAIKNFQKVSNLEVRGKVMVYRWGNTSL